MFGGLGVGIDHPNVIVEAEQRREFPLKVKKPSLPTTLAKRFFTATKCNPTFISTLKRQFPLMLV